MLLQLNFLEYSIFSILQVRVQCFHYLLPQGAMKHVSNSHDIDPRVSNFSRVLSSIDEAMTVSLQPRKCKVKFSALYHHFSFSLFPSYFFDPIIIRLHSIFSSLLARRAQVQKPLEPKELKTLSLELKELLKNLTKTKT